MIDTLVTFGDSWPSGEELSPGEKTFGEIIAGRLNVRFRNFSEKSTSADHMILQLEKYIDNRESRNDLALFFLTEYSRFLTWHENGKPLQISVHDSKHDNFYRYAYNDKLGVFRINQTILCLQAICSKFNIQDRYVIGWTKFPITLKGININKIYDRGSSTCLDMFKVYPNDPTHDPNFLYYDYNHFVKPNQAHPNQLGHQTIADNLLEWIENDRTLA